MKNICSQMTRKAWLALVMVLCLSFPALAQKITVTGTVTEPEGEPAIGASVTVKGQSGFGVATDYDGNYSIQVAPDAVLEFSYVGCDTQEVPVGNRTVINVKLVANSTMLNEVVAIGYGTVKKEDATGSVAVVKPDEIEAGLATSVQDMLVGQTPGVVVTTKGGPAGKADIRIRGGASLSATNDPLIVLDGVPLSADTPLGMGSPLSMINPESIESMTILKDASATAIYGSRASNGVIIITTKKGVSGKPQVTFTANMYVDYARKLTKVHDPEGLRALIVRKFGENSPAEGYMGTANTDWQDQVFRTAISQDYSLAVAGTVGKVLPYRVDASYTRNNGIVKNSDMDRATVGISLTPTFGNLKVNAKVKGYYVHNNWDMSDAIGQAVAYNPSLPIRDNIAISGGTAAGDFAYLFGGYTEPWTLSGGNVNLEPNASYNPVATLEMSRAYSDVYRSNGNLQLDYAFPFLPELHANLNLGYDITKSDDYYVVDANSHMAWKNHSGYGGGSRTHKYALSQNMLLEFYLNYKKMFEAIQSNLDVTAGYTWSRDRNKGWNDGSNPDAEPGIATTPGLNPATFNGSEYFLDFNPSTVDQVGKPFKPDPIDKDGNYHWKNHLQLLSFFGRVNYTFKDRYLLTATLRADATSRFSKDNRWGIFPAVALGWRISEESFMEGARSWWNDLKLRAGWGETGQQAVGSTNNYTPTYTVSQPGSYYPNGFGGWLTPYFPNGYNPDLKWETTTTWNVGIDFGFMNNRISGTIEYYLRNTRDLLSDVPVAAGSSTVAYLPQNIGKMRNYGIEFAINAKPIVTNDFVWNVSYNIGWNHNKIVDLNGLTFGVGGGAGTGGNVQIQKEGYPAFSYNLYQQVYDANGDPVQGAYVDQNGDGVIDTNDLIVNHARDPKVTMTFASNFRYKQWDFGFSLRASFGNYVYASALRGGSNLNGLFRNNQVSNLFVTDYYFDSNDTKLDYSDYWLRNASFVRCDNINLGYTFENLLKNKLRLRVFAAVQNPFVITKYKGLDPEVFDGIDGNIYPRATTWSLGLVANF